MNSERITLILTVVGFLGSVLFGAYDLLHARHTDYLLLEIRDLIIKQR